MVTRYTLRPLLNLLKHNFSIIKLLSSTFVKMKPPIVLFLEATLKRIIIASYFIYISLSKKTLRLKSGPLFHKELLTGLPSSLIKILLFSTSALRFYMIVYYFATRFLPYEEDHARD